MEQHPIPQDVTGFQFKLIGAMTVKQFGFVAVGAILAVVSWYVPAQGFFWNFLAKGIFMPIFGLSGVIIAFVPIEGRPVDVMAANFFHALTSPNQYVYKKKGRKFSFSHMAFAKIQPASTTTSPKKTNDATTIDYRKEQQLRALLSRGYQDSKSNLDNKEIQFLKSVSSLPTPPSPQPETAHDTVHTPTLLSIQTSAPSQSTYPQMSASQPAPAIQPLPSSQQARPQAELSQKPSVSQKSPSEDELLKLKNQMPPASSAAPAPAQTIPGRAAPQNTAHVHNIPQSMIKNAGFSHIPDSPNIIVGIVKDSRGNMLPNILVEIKDKDGNPVRAFKTNPLGQFASATPLANASYTIELEDPKKQHAFDVIQVTADGQIMMPIEIISHDAREELRKALFTN